MVLGRLPKKYKHFIKILTSQLMIYEQINTTAAKARHLRKAGNKLLSYARKAANGNSAAKNLLQGRVSTDKVQKKLLVNLIPRLRNIKGGNFITVSKINHRRRGDNAPVVTVSIKGNQKAEHQRNERQAKLKSGQIIDIKSINKKWLLEQKAHYESVISQKPEMQKFLRQKINRIDYEIWTQTKTRRQPPRYTLLA